MILKAVKAKQDVRRFSSKDDKGNWIEDGEQFATKDKIYPVIIQNELDFAIIDDTNDQHMFYYSDCDYFELIYESELTGTQDSGLKDSGARIEYITGAQREPSDNKGAFELLDYELLKRVAVHLEKGAIKYSPNNWRKGISVSRCAQAASRHLAQYINGQNDEDHLAACVCNIMFIMNYEKYKPELQDLYMWKEGAECRNDQ